jgi:hypothetical protein
MAGYLGQKPTPSPLTTSDLSDDIVTTAKIAAGAVTSAKLAADAAITDLTPVRQDIAMLALYNAVSDNKAAYNLPFSFIDQFEDDTGITTETTVDRDATGEYVSSISTVVAAFSNDSNTKLLLHMDDTGLTDSSSGTHAVTIVGNSVRSSTQSKFGSYSVALDGSGDYLTYGTGAHSDFAWGTGDFTIELWYRPTASVANSMLLGQWGGDTAGGGDGYRWGIHSKGSGLSLQMHMQTTSGVIVADQLVVDTWTHIAVVRSGSGTNNTKMYTNGVQSDQWTNTVSFTSSGKIWVSGAATGGQNAQGFIDEARISNSARYTGTFTPNSTTTISATGTLISDTQTSSVATTKMSGVILYKDNGSGASTLGTHLKIYLSANGGTNWTEVVAADYGAVTPLFSTGVKMVRLAEQTVTSGTTPVMKAVWASQASGTLETQLHGWAMNY